MLTCPDFAHVRSSHTHAVEYLQQPPHLMWFPLATVHPQEVAYQRLKFSRAGPFLDRVIHASVDRHILYTDGTWDRSKSQNCCRTAWEVIRQVHKNSQDPSVHYFEVFQTSHVQGTQSINRGEFGAAAWVSDFYSKQIPWPFVDLHTGSQIVVKIIEAIATQTVHYKKHQMVHCDLIHKIRSTWDPFHFRVLKTKSHKSLQSADTNDLYSILGNILADETTKITNKQDLEVRNTITDNIDQLFFCTGGGAVRAERHKSP